MDFIERRPDEPLVHKTTRNAFTSTDLLPILLQAGVTRIAIAGIQTEQCCETTARVGADLGFAVDFVTEATLTFPIPKSDAPDAEVLSTADIVERTEYVLRGRFARIVTVAQIEGESPVPAGG
jgi:nicotinamidase-related amidase